MPRTDHAPSRAPRPTAQPVGVSESFTAPNGRVRPGARRRGNGPRLRGPELAALAWQQHGACRTADGAVFFAPDQPGEVPAVRMRRLLAAKRVCAGCPVRLPCRSYALENQEEFGVWGGLSETERKNLIAERRR